MATGSQNMSTSNTSQISSINTIKITKKYNPNTTVISPCPSPKTILKSSNKTAHILSSTLDENNNSSITTESVSSQNNFINSENVMKDTTYADLIERQTDEYAQIQGLKVKTKSIESSLLPLVTQITTLVNFKEKFVPSTRTANSLLRVGQAVNFAVERFVEVGENIGYENPTIKFDMLVACNGAKESGEVIRQQITLALSNNNKIRSIEQESQIMVQAANTLLNSVIKVLLLADVVIINQLLSSKNKALLTLHKLESVVDFWSFVSFFTQYGNDLIELAHLSGERQNDLKDEKLKSQLSSARWVLEKSTAMILSSSKAYLKHLECECAKENISLVYSFLQEALDIVHFVAVESGTYYKSTSPVFNSMFKTSPIQISFTNSYRHFEETLDLEKNGLLMENQNTLVQTALNRLFDSLQDYTFSMYINNEQRESIVKLQNEVRDQTLTRLRSEESVTSIKETDYSTIENSNDPASQKSCSFKTASILASCAALKKLIYELTMELSNNLFKENEDATLLNLIKTYSASNHYDLLIEALDKFKEYSDHVLELCKLLRHISTIDVFEVTCEHHYNVFEYLAKMIQSAAGTAALYPQCKSAIENLYLFCDSWETQVNDLSILVKEMQDLINSMSTQSKASSSKTVYYSLPRPGKHGSNVRQASLPRGSKLDSDEQAKMTKLGLEMKLITSEIESEAEKWNEPQNEIVKVAKAMSEMAYEIHLFTRGEGSLKTTQDLFARAQEFLNNGVVLNGIIKNFLVQVPGGCLKEELMQLLEKLPENFKKLKGRLKQVTVGKTATFNKVDWVIQETRDFMNLIAKLVTSCFLCCTKYNINYDNSESKVDFSLQSIDSVNEKQSNLNNNKRAESCDPKDIGN